MIVFFDSRYSDVADRQKMLWDAKYQTLSKQLNITEQQEKKIKGNLPVKMLNIGTERIEQTLQTQIRLLL